MKKLLIGLCLLSTASFASSDKYQQNNNDPEAKGITAGVVKGVATGIGHVASFIIKLPVAMYEQVVENGTAGDHYIELDGRDLFDDKDKGKKVIRLSTDFYPVMEPDEDGTALLPMKITVALESGEGLTIEEARASVFRLVSQEYGLTWNYLTIGHEKPIEFTSDALGHYSYGHFMEFDYNEVLWSTEDGGMDVVFGGYASGGGMTYLRSNGNTKKDFNGTLYKYDASLGMRFNNVLNTGDVVLEAFTKNIKMDTTDHLQRNGVQAVFKEKRGRFSVTAGYAEESYEGVNAPSEEFEEYYVRGKYHFNAK